MNEEEFSFLIKDRKTDLYVWIRNLICKNASLHQCFHINPKLANIVSLNRIQNEFKFDSQRQVSMFVELARILKENSLLTGEHLSEEDRVCVYILFVDLEFQQNALAHMSNETANDLWHEVNLLPDNFELTIPKSSSSFTHSQSQEIISPRLSMYPSSFQSKFIKRVRNRLANNNNSVISVSI